MIWATIYHDTDLLPLLDDLAALLYGSDGKAELKVIMTTADRLRAEGEARGEARGRAIALIELLTVKFGQLSAEVAATVHETDSDLLQVWTARVLTADTLDEVFQP